MAALAILLLAYVAASTAAPPIDTATARHSKHLPWPYDDPDGPFKPIPASYPAATVHEANARDLARHLRSIREDERVFEGRTPSKGHRIYVSEQQISDGLEREPRSVFEQNEHEQDEASIEEHQETVTDDFEEHPGALLARQKRSFQPRAPDYGRIAVGERNWGADVIREGPDTRVEVNAKRRGEKVDVEGQWSKVVSGPGKAKPNWRVGIRW